jgi:hypothetical protein
MSPKNPRCAGEVVVLSLLAMLQPFTQEALAAPRQIEFCEPIQLVDEQSRPARIGSGPGGATQIGWEGSGQSPDGRFATNDDGDISGWRQDTAGQTMDPLRIPMFWLRTSNTEWTPVRLPAGVDNEGLVTSAAATGSVRYRTGPGAHPSHVFITGWRQISRGSNPSYAPMLWMIRWDAKTGYDLSDPVVLPAAPHWCPSEALPDILASIEQGSAWSNGAIEVVFPPAADPVIAVYATQAFRCQCSGTLSEMPGIQTAMSIRFTLPDALQALAVTSTAECACGSAGACAPFHWQLTDGFPTDLPVVAASGGTRILVCSREPMSVVRTNDSELAVVRDGHLETRRNSCGLPGGGGNWCASIPDDSVIGPRFGSLVFDDWDDTDTAPLDRFLIARNPGEPLLPGVKTTPGLALLWPRGHCLSGYDSADPTNAQPYQSRQFDSAISSDTTRRIAIAGRRLDCAESGVILRPMAWFPLELHADAGPDILCPDQDGSACIPLGSPPVQCDPIIPRPNPDPNGVPAPCTENGLRPEQAFGLSVQLPFVTVSQTAQDSTAHALACEFVSIGSNPELAMFAGGGTMGARVWYPAGAGWSVSLISQIGSEAQAITRDGSVVVIDPPHPQTAGYPVRVFRIRAPGDVNQDGVVGAADLSAVLNAWGQPATASCQSADLTGDGQVNAADLSAVLANWG